MEAVLKKIKIKTGVVKRIAKEKIMYKQEAESIRKKIEEMKASGQDEYDIKKRGEVLQESEMMEPDCCKRLAAAIEELSNLVDQNEELKENEVYQTAKAVLLDVQN